MFLDSKQFRLVQAYISPALQTASLDVKTVYQNAVGVLSASFRKMAIFYKSRKHPAPIGPAHEEGNSGFSPAP